MDAEFGFGVMFVLTEGGSGDVDFVFVDNEASGD
jgi:hypothetical protein